MPNSELKKSFGTVLVKSFEEYKKCWWFKILYTIAVVVMLGLMVQFSVSYTIDRKNHQAKIEHQANYQTSRTTYAAAKNTLNKYLDRIDADYLFLIEYHNGNENIITGIQFCKFDMTLEVTSDSVPFVSYNKFKDDLVARYDILNDGELYEEGMVCLTKSQLKHRDKYLYHQLEYVNGEYFALSNLCSAEGNYAALCAISSDDELNQIEILKCKTELEHLFNK